MNPDFSVKLDVILGKRCSGKSTDLMKVALEKINSGTNVLFICPTRMMCNLVFGDTRDVLKSDKYTYYPHELLIVFDTKNELKFISHQEITSVTFRGNKYDGYFRILDNADMLLPIVDLMSINGNYIKPSFNKE